MSDSLTGSPQDSAEASAEGIAALTTLVSTLETANTRLAAQNAELQQSNAALAAACQQAEAAVAGHTRQLAHLLDTQRAERATNAELARHNAALQATIEALQATNAELAAQGADLQRLTRRQEALQRRLLQGVIGAQENERRRVARELHDDTGQALTALVLALGVIQQTLPESATREQHILEDATGLAENMMGGLRRVIADLRPPVLDDLGLVPALRRLGRDLQERAGVAVTVQAADLAGRLPPEVEITLFRVAQEALANIGKHAQARQARVLLRREPGRVTLRITDNGRGLPDDRLPDQAAAHVEAHFGLLGMQERVALLNGVFRVEGTPGHGTTIWVEVPMEGA